MAALILLFIIPCLISALCKCISNEIGRSEQRRKKAERERAKREAEQIRIERQIEIAEARAEREAERAERKLALLESRAIQGRIDIDCYEPIKARLEAELESIYDEAEAMQITVNGDSASGFNTFTPPIALAEIDKLNKKIATIDKRLEKAYYSISCYEREKARY